MPRIKIENMSKTAKNRQAMGATAQDVAQALNLDIRVIYVLENYTTEQLQGLYSEYINHIATLEATASTRQAVARLQQMAELARELGKVTEADALEAEALQLTSGNIDLVMPELSQLGAKKAKKQAKAEAVAV